MLVSGNELRLAIKAGFDPTRWVLCMLCLPCTTCCLPDCLPHCLSACGACLCLPTYHGGAVALPPTSLQSPLCLLPCLSPPCLPTSALCRAYLQCCLPPCPACPALPRRTIFNGNGKLPRELELAVDNGVLINVDSEFDLANIQVGALPGLGCWFRVLAGVPPGGVAWGAWLCCCRAG